MKTEIDPKIAWSVIAVVVLLVVAAYYFFFRTPSGELSAKEAGAGNPVRPGEISPNIPPPPWATPSSAPSGQPQPASPNPR